MGLRPAQSRRFTGTLRSLVTRPWSIIWLLLIILRCSTTSSAAFRGPGGGKGSWPDRTPRLSGPTTTLSTPLPPCSWLRDSRSSSGVCSCLQRWASPPWPAAGRWTALLCAGSWSGANGIHQLGRAVRNLLYVSFLEGMELNSPVFDLLGPALAADANDFRY